MAAFHGTATSRLQMFSFTLIAFAVAFSLDAAAPAGRTHSSSLCDPPQGNAEIDAKLIS